MFGKKHKEKDKEVSKIGKGGNSSNILSTATTVTKLQNGANMTTHTTTSTKVFSREERTVQFESRSGSFSTSGVSMSLQNPTRFTSRSIFDDNVPRSEILGHDAIPFVGSYGAQRNSVSTYRSPYSTFSSYPTPLNPSTSSNITASTFNTPVSLYQSPSSVVALPPSTTRTNNVVPTYEHKSRKLGKALIINNINFTEKKEERKGAEKDSEDLKRLLKKLGFDVNHYTNVKGKDMLNKAKQFSKSSFSEHSISLVVMMSHGSNRKLDGDKDNAVRGGFTQIFGVDSSSVLVDDIIDMFVKDNYHQSLKGKPKIFIFQCCRGSEDQEIHYDSVPMEKPRVKEHSDILVAFSTLPGYLSNRDPTRGSWYIQSLCQVIERHHKDYHIEDMLKIVDEELSKRHPKYTQTSTYENRGFKTCFWTKS